MRPIFGEFECKIDSKGRFVLTSGLKKQLPEGDQNQFVINRGLDECLVLYPLKVWEEELRKIYALNQYSAKNRAFARKFRNGAKPIDMDNSSRVLVPKPLMGYAHIEKELVLVASFDRIEIWDKATYEKWLDSDRYDMEELSEEVMGGLDNDGK